MPFRALLSYNLSWDVEVISVQLFKPKWLQWLDGSSAPVPHGWNGWNLGWNGTGWNSESLKLSESSESNQNNGSGNMKGLVRRPFKVAGDPCSDQLQFLRASFIFVVQVSVKCEFFESVISIKMSRFIHLYRRASYTQNLG